MKTPALPLAILSRWGTRTLLLVALAASLAACYPGTVDNITELDLIVTNYDTEFNFQSIRYYAMSDEVIDIFAAAGLKNPDIRVSGGTSRPSCYRTFGAGSPIPTSIEIVSHRQPSRQRQNRRHTGP